jgi:hypothetical protein
MVTPLVSEILFWGAVLTYHELGHLLFFGAYGRKVKIRLTLLGIEAGTAKDTLALKGYQLWNVLLAGIAFGAVPFALSPRPLLDIIIYTALCTGDLVMMFYLLDVFIKTRRIHERVIIVEMERLIKIAKEIESEESAKRLGKGNEISETGRQSPASAIRMREARGDACCGKGQEGAKMPDLSRRNPSYRTGTRKCLFCGKEYSKGKRISCCGFDMIAVKGESEKTK